MSKERFLTSLSYNIYLRKPARLDNSNTILLRVIIERKKRDFNLNVSWPAKYFDSTAQEALPRKKNDLETETVNTVISEAKAKCHNIKMKAFAKGITITHDLFQREFENYESKENFIWYWRQKMNHLYHGQLISKPTFKRHKVSLDNGFIEFIGGNRINFNEIDFETLQRYEVWLRRTKKYQHEGKPCNLQHNTICGYLKDLRTYLNHAIKDGYIIRNPFTDFKFRYRDGFREALDDQELQILITMLEKPLLPLYRSVLERFLFSCFTGIRISDTHQVTTSKIHNGVLSLKMKKGERFGKVVQIPLPLVALKLIEGRKGYLFEPLADQTCNDALKIIAGIAGINKRLTYHVSRDTFGTMFIEMGGDPVTLKELMGHTNISTTMIYVKISEKRKETLMSNFDKKFGQPAGIS